MELNLSHKDILVSFTLQELTRLYWGWFLEYLSWRRDEMRAFFGLFCHISVIIFLTIPNSFYPLF